MLLSANRRYVEFISTSDDRNRGIKLLNKISKTVVEKDRPYKGFNFFSNDDQKLFHAIISGEFNISGFQNKNLRQKLPEKSSGQISRQLKRLRTHGIIKKIRRTYKYYLTKLGRKVIISGLKLKELFLVPELAAI